MWVLNQSSQSLQAKCSEAVVTTDLDFITIYHRKSGNLNYGPITNPGTLDDNLAPIIPSPADADSQHDVRYINVNNRDTINHNLTFYFSNGTDFVIFKCLLEPGWSAIWEQETGWRVFDENGNEVRIVSLSSTSQAGITLDGQGGVISTGSKGYVLIPYNCSIVKWYIIGDVVGSIVIDVKRVGVSIIGAGNKPTLTAQQSNNATAAGWTSLSIIAFDELEFNVDSASTVNRVNLFLILSK